MDLLSVKQGSAESEAAIMESSCEVAAHGAVKSRTEMASNETGVQVNRDCGQSESVRRRASQLMMMVDVNT